jgi:hypothetical protein
MKSNPAGTESKMEPSMARGALRAGFGSQIVFRAGFSAYTVFFPASPSMVSGAYSIMGYDRTPYPMMKTTPFEV